MEDGKKKVSCSYALLVIVLFATVCFLTCYIVIERKLNDGNMANNVGDNNGIVNNTQAIPDENNKVDINKNDLVSYMNDLRFPISTLLVRQGDPKKDIDYLESLSNRQLLVIEYILVDNCDYSGFTVCGSSGCSYAENGVDPTMDATSAYCSYKLFNENYKKLFGINFDMNNKEVSRGNTSYDNSDDYVYYHNVRSGSNGIGIDDIEVIDYLFNDDGSILSVDLKFNYSDMFNDRYNVAFNDATMEFTINNNDMFLKSLVLK